MTGLYPLEHGVRTNGPANMDPHILHIAKVAHEKNYKTSFFSGGAPVLKRHPLYLGFEIFDDSPKNFETTAKLFKQWIDQNKKNKFLSFIYVPDLLNSETPTINDVGEIRAPTHEAQIDELDETLFSIIGNLKTLKIYDSTTIILVGLNGSNNSERVQEIKPVNLHSENTQVAFFIKPPQKYKETDENWKIDKNISLADLGFTLFDFLKSPSPKIKNFSEILPRVSLKNAIEKNNTDWSNERRILIESAWSAWRQKEEIRYAQRIDHIMMIWDSRPKIFNTLLDRQEVIEIPISDPNLINIKGDLFSFFKSMEWPRWRPLSYFEILKYGLNIPTFQANQKEFKNIESQLQFLNKENPEDEDITSLLAEFYIINKNWIGLKKIAETYSKNDWMTLAESHLNEKIQGPVSSCMNLFISSKNSLGDLKKCNDTSLVEFYLYLKDLSKKDALQRDLSKKKILHSYKNMLHFRGVLQKNFNLQFILDTIHIKNKIPSNLELVLNLPKLETLRKELEVKITNASKEQENFSQIDF
jgi:hypothetical protein